MKEFKEILLILLRFLGTWLLLFLLYQLYLNPYTENIDPYTEFISNQSHFLLQVSGYEVTTMPFPSHQTIQFYLNGKVATRMIEGCNAVSVMILFLAFVFSFYKGKETFYFSLAGMGVLYVLNLTRIYLLNRIVADSPQWTKAAHDYFFPAIIYGGMVLLWLFWINRYTKRYENG